MSFKKTIRSLHLFLGLLSGLVVFIVALSGSIYAFEKEIRSVIHRDLYTCHQPGNTRLSMDDLLDTVRTKYKGQKIRNVQVFAEPDRNIQVNLKNKTAVFVNPYTGSIAGDFNQDKEVLGIVLQLHRRLLLGEAGEAITGASALVFFVMLVSGIILWWPRSARSLKHKTRLSFRFGPRRALFDLHNVAGFYASWILLFTVLSGLVMSYKWAEKTMFSLAGSKKDERKFKSAPLATRAGLEGIAAKYGQLYPGKQKTFVLPEDSSGTIRISVLLDASGFYNQVDHFFVDQYSGDEVHAKKFSEQNAGERLRATTYNIHTGKVFGLFGEIVVFFAGLIAASLPVTGFLLWRHKRRKKVNGLLEEEFLAAKN